MCIIQIEMLNNAIEEHYTTDTMMMMTLCQTVHHQPTQKYVEKSSRRDTHFYVALKGIKTLEFISCDGICRSKNRASNEC